MLLQPIDSVTQKAANLVWGLELEKDLQQVEAAVQAALPHEDPMVSEMSVADKMLFGAFSWPFIGKS